MKIGTMFKDIVASFFKKTSTQLYPFEKTRAPERYRGNLFYDPSACTGCCLCVKDCPSKAIELDTLGRAAKRFAEISYGPVYLLWPMCCELQIQMYGYDQPGLGTCSSQ